MRTPACFEDRETRSLIEELCKKNHIDMQLLVELCEIVQKQYGLGRREGLASDISTCIDAYLTRTQSTKR